MTTPVLQDAQLDALTEVCGIGMGHAATALSQLMGKTVSIEVPRLRMVETARLAEQLDSEEVAGLQLQILGNVRGSMLILLRMEDAGEMVRLLLGGQQPARPPYSELEVSTLKEVGNIVASACLNALGLLFRMTLLPSVPVLLTGEAGSVLSRLLGDAPRGESMVTVDTVFSIGEALCGGSILLAPEAASLGAMLAALGHS